MFDNYVFKTIAEMALVEEGKIELSDNLQHIGIDSLRLVELIFALEEKNNIRFKDSDLAPSNLITVQDVVNLTNKSV